MKTQSKLEVIVSLINDMDTNELIDLNNTYCRENNIDSEVFENDEEFFNMFFENKPFEVVRACHFGSYNFSDDYVQFNGYGNLDTLNYFEVKDLCESAERIAEYAIENESEFSHLFDFDELEVEEDEA